MEMWKLGTTEMGKIYRAWMDVKAVFTGENRHTILSNCEAGEDATQKAYKKLWKQNVYRLLSGNC